MNRLLLTFILTALWQFCLAQNGIQLKSKHYEEERLIPENSLVRIETKEGLKFSGAFQITIANNLFIEGNIVALEDIRVIKTKALKRGRKIAGGIMLASGITLSMPFILGSIFPPESIAGGFALAFISVPLIAIGIPTTIVGATLLGVNQRYMFYDWEFKIAIPNE
jgi:hypothetical protein